MPHLYEIITDGELEAYIRSLIDRTRSALPVAVASPRKKVDVVPQTTSILQAEAEQRRARRRRAGR